MHVDKNMAVGTTFGMLSEDMENATKKTSAATEVFFSGEKGIRTLGTQSVQRFSRPPRSTTPASLLTALLDRVFHYKGDLRRLAETEGFEPPKPFGLTVFKTAAIDHSAISPLQKYNIFR